jgi:MoxR-like ATPase
VAGARGGAEGLAVEATAAFVRGNHALAAGDPDGAEKEHRAALAAAAKDHPHRARIVEALVTQLSLRRRHAECAELAAAEAAGLPAGTSRASTIVAGLSCARHEERTAEVDQLLALALHDARAQRSPLLPDDRSALYEELVATKK